MKWVDRIFGWLLVLGALLHAVGSWVGYRTTPEVMLWSLSGTLAALLVAALNLLRVSRPNDLGLAWVSLMGSTAWVIIALCFGMVIGNIFDPRVIIHAINALILAAMSLRTILKKS